MSKKPVQDTREINNKIKWSKEITSVIDDKDQLLKQFNKDCDSKNVEELAYKLYVYKKNNLNLFHKILTQHYLTVLTAEKNKDKKIKKIVAKTNESKKEIFPAAHGTVWNMMQNFRYKQRSGKEYDEYSVKKLIQDDQFLQFVFNAMLTTMDYDKALKTIYDKYIKEDEYLNKQLSIYESYYMYINEEVNIEYQKTIASVLQENDLKLSEDGKIDRLIYSKLSELIDINSSFVRESLESYNNETKLNLFDFFNQTIPQVLEIFKEFNIDYNDIFDNNNDKLTADIKKANTILTDESISFLILVMTNLEINNFLYIDSEETITMTYFICVIIIFKLALDISL